MSKNMSRFCNEILSRIKISNITKTCPWLNLRKCQKKKKLEKKNINKIKIDQKSICSGLDAQMS